MLKSFQFRFFELKSNLPMIAWLACFALIIALVGEDFSHAGGPKIQSVPHAGTGSNQKLQRPQAPAAADDGDDDNNKPPNKAAGTPNKTAIKSSSKLAPVAHTALTSRKKAFANGVMSELPGKSLAKIRAKLEGKNPQEQEKRHEVRAHHDAYQEALGKFDKAKDNPDIKDNLTRTAKMNKHFMHAERAHQQIEKGLGKPTHGFEKEKYKDEHEALQAVSKDKSELEKRRALLKKEDFHELGEDSVAENKSSTRAERDVTLNNAQGAGRVTTQVAKGTTAVVVGLGVAAGTGGIGTAAAVGAGVQAVNTGIDVGRTVARTKDVNETLRKYDPGTDEGAKAVAEKNAKHDKIAQAHGAVKAATSLGGVAGEAAINGVDALSLIDAPGGVKDTRELGKAAVKAVK